MEDVRSRLVSPAQSPSDADEESNPELEHDRHINDERLKTRFEHIFEKYERDFTGVGDEIDLETGEIVVDNGHLENMRGEADPGESASFQFVRAFAEDLEQGSDLEDSEDGEGLDGADEDNDSVSDDEKSTPGSASGDFSAPEQDLESATSPTDIDDIPIDPLLSQLQAAAVGPKPHLQMLAVSHPDLPVPGCSDSTADYRSVHEQSTEENSSGRISPVNVMDMPAVKQSMAALKVKRGRDVDPEAIRALGMSIASQIAELLGSSKRTKAQRKRKEREWEYPELPIDSQARAQDQPLPKRPRLPLFAPEAVALANEPKESLWAPIRHPRRHRRKCRAAADQAQASLQPQDPSKGGLHIVPEHDEAEAPLQTGKDGLADLSVLKQCYHCGIKATPSWRRGPDGELCNACGMYLYRYGLMKPLRSDTPSDSDSECGSAVQDEHSAHTTRHLTSTAPRNRNSRFSPQEDALLIKLKEIDEMQWAAIGRHFPGRSAFAVQCRYSKKLIGVECEGRRMLIDQGFTFDKAADRGDGGFTSTDDELLVQLREENELDWHVLAQYFVEKPAADIERRYNALIDGTAYQPNRKKRPEGNYLPKSIYHRFSEEEDALLIHLREVQQLSWDALAERFPTRSQLSLQKRYVRGFARRKAAAVANGEPWPPPHLKDMSKNRRFVNSAPDPLTQVSFNYTYEEDDLLLRLREENGLDWTSISRQLPGRDCESVKARYTYIMAKMGRRTRFVPELIEYHNSSSNGSVSPCSVQGESLQPRRLAIDESDALSRSLDVDTTAGYTCAVNRTRYTDAEDQFLLEMKDNRKMSWEGLALRFPGRTVAGLMARYTQMQKPGHNSRITNIDSTPGFASNCITSIQDAIDPDLAGPSLAGSPRTGREEVHPSRMVDFNCPPPKPFRSEEGYMSSKGCNQGIWYTQQEKDLIVELYRQGLSWPEISERLPGRTASSIESIWFSSPAGRQVNLPVSAAISAGREIETPLLRRALDNKRWRLSNNTQSPLNLFNSLSKQADSGAVDEELESTGAFDILKLPAISPSRLESSVALLRSLSPANYSSPRKSSADEVSVNGSPDFTTRQHLPQSQKSSILALQSPIHLRGLAPKGRFVQTVVAEARARSASPNPAPMTPLSKPSTDERRAESVCAKARTAWQSIESCAPMEVDMPLPQRPRRQQDVESTGVPKNTNAQQQLDAAPACSEMPHLHTIDYPDVDGGESASETDRTHSGSSSGISQSPTEDPLDEDDHGLSQANANAQFWCPAIYPLQIMPSTEPSSIPLKFEMPEAHVEARPLPSITGSIPLHPGTPQLPTTDYIYSTQAANIPVASMAYLSPERYDLHAHPYFAAPPGQPYIPKLMQTPCADWASSVDAADPNFNSIVTPSLAGLNAQQRSHGPLDAKLLYVDAKVLNKDANASKLKPKPKPNVDIPALVKPPFSWNELVRMALRSTPKQEMVIQDVYKYITDTFPYYQKRDGRWRNGLRVHLVGCSDFEKLSRGDSEASWGFAQEACGEEVTHIPSQNKSGVTKRGAGPRRTKKDTEPSYTERIATAESTEPSQQLPMPGTVFADESAQVVKPMSDGIAGAEENQDGNVIARDKALADDMPLLPPLSSPKPAARKLFDSSMSAPAKGSDIYREPKSSPAVIRALRESVKVTSFLDHRTATLLHSSNFARSSSPECTGMKRPAQLRGHSRAARSKVPRSNSLAATLKQQSCLTTNEPARKPSSAVGRVLATQSRSSSVGILGSNRRFVRTIVPDVDGSEDELAL